MSKNVTIGSVHWDGDEARMLINYSSPVETECLSMGHNAEQICIEGLQLEDLEHIADVMNVEVQDRRIANETAKTAPA